MLVNKEPEWSLDDLVHQQVRWGVFLPPAQPAQFDEPPLNAGASVTSFTSFNGGGMIAVML